MSASDEALKVNIYPTGNAFTRNPIFLSVSSYSMATYSIRMNNEEIFKGNGIGEFRVNIAEIVETGIASTPILPDNTEPLLAVSGLSAKVTIHVVNEGEEEYNLSFTAWKGGISKKEFKRLRNMGTDIFSLKFLNESCNFFFTTRSNDWRITGQSLAVPGTAGNFYALNLEAVRLKFFTDYGVLANLFDVYSGDTFALRIGIEQSPTVRERYRLRFLNSYGTYRRT